ncbi:MAG: TIGR03790 family protein [Ignavibacteriae bacterium]|nr:TIGR03790 family protein [Ignavibacteriota bacterium]
MKSLKTCVTLAVTLLFLSRMEAVASYDDVAVVVNTNSQNAMAIGAYFMNARSIPPVNMIYVSTDTTEEIDSTRFNALRSQIEQYLTANNLVNSINYIVTTKGLPLKVNRGNLFSTQSPSSSVESELMLILGSWSTYIARNGARTSPYFAQTAHFSRATYGLYLVTRLDGYTVQQVYDLIDRGGPGITVTSSGKFVLDQDPTYVSEPLNRFLAQATPILQGKGYDVLLDSTTVYRTYNNDVLGYVSWGSNDRNANNYTQYAIPYNTYVRGALAETYVSTSGRSFDSPPSYGQSLVSDLVNEGVTGVKGYVYEPYSVAMAEADILFDRYTSNYNLAESYFMASPWLSWMDVVIGDPKTSITLATGPLPIQLAGFQASYNAISNTVELEWQTISEINNYGFFVQHRDSSSPNFVDLPGSFIPGQGTTNVPQFYSWTHTNPQPGVAYYRLRQVDLDETQHFSDAQQVVVTPLTNIVENGTPTGFALAQNYPNPFNPSTQIEFSVENTDRTSVEVYSVIGEHVATLFDGVAQSGERYNVRFDASGLASGLYFYRLQNGQQQALRKMTLLN